MGSWVQVSGERRLLLPPGRDVPAAGAASCCASFGLAFQHGEPMQWCVFRQQTPNLLRSPAACCWRCPSLTAADPQRQEKRRRFKEARKLHYNMREQLAR